MAAARHLERPAIVQASHHVSWAQVHAMSIDSARRLPGTGVVVNLCRSRLGFLVTWLAALRTGRAMWLPSSSGQGDLFDALADEASACMVVDEPGDLERHGPAAVPCVALDWLPAPMVSVVGATGLAWQPSWDAPAVVLHSSGSTGRPTAHPKTLLQLALGALALGERLWPNDASTLRSPELRQLLSSVAPAHLFGFEASVMLPLVFGLTLIDRRPLLPADVEQAMAASTRPCLWITTPMHLRALVRSGLRIAGCSEVLCSTMPLSADTAREAEALVAARVVEVYGSTETGALATRLTAAESEWTPLAGVSLRQVDEPPTPVAGQAPHLAFSPHFDSPVRLADRIALSASGRFALLGRDGDLLKIAGHRASLASLNLLLLDMPGLRDGVLFMPDAPPRTEVAGSDTDTDRLCLVYGSDTLDRAQIELWWRQRVSAVFVPRVFIRVDRLPRNALGKVPRAALDALHAEWLARQGRFQLVVPVDHPALAGHFPGRPIVPGALLLEALLSGFAACTGRTIDRVEHARFVGACLPGDAVTVRYEIDADRCRMSASAARIEGPCTVVTLTARCMPTRRPDDRARQTAAALPRAAAPVAFMAELDP